MSTDRSQEIKNQREQELNDLRSLLSTDYGKRFLSRLVERAGVFQPTYASGTNPSDFAFMEGRREMGLFIIGEITQANTDAWIAMQIEHFKQLKALDEKVSHERNEQHSDDN